MRAIVQDEYGGPEMLRLVELPDPEPGPGEVLVRVAASSVNAADWHVMRGDPWIARWMDRSIFGSRGPRGAVRGIDVAGTVAALGAGVVDLAVGDHVFGEVDGAFADLVVAPRERLARSPARLGDEEVAALPLAAGTALLALGELAPPSAGDRVVVHGASGGVGPYAVQLAVAAGAEVTGVCSTRNVDLVRGLGARAVDYRVDDVAEVLSDQDLVLDVAGGRTLRDWRRVLRRGGRLLLAGGGVWDGGSRVGPVWLMVRGPLAAPFLPYRVTPVVAAAKQERLERIATLADDGVLAPIIERTYPLEQAADAVRHLEQEHARTKIVVSVAAS